jgi:hypothetical protein
MILHLETVLAQLETNSVLRAGTLDRPHLSRFARTVKSLDDLEPIIGAVLAEHIEPGESIHQIIAAPRQAVLRSRHTAERWFGMLLPWELTPDWVLVLMEERVLVAAVDQPGAMPVVTSTRIADILSLEMGAILLHAWLEWTFPAQGRTGRTRIHYNAVCQRFPGSLGHYAARSECTSNNPGRSSPGISVRPAVQVHEHHHAQLAATR